MVKKVIRGLGRNKQQRLKLKCAFRFERQHLERFSPVIGNVLIKIVVIAVADFSAPSRPQWLLGVQRFGFNLDFLGFRLARLLRRPFINDGVRDKIRIFLDDHRELPAIGIVLNAIFGVRRF